MTCRKAGRAVADIPVTWPDYGLEDGRLRDLECSFGPGLFQRSGSNRKGHNDLHHAIRVTRLQARGRQDLSPLDRHFDVALARIAADVPRSARPWRWRWRMHFGRILSSRSGPGRCRPAFDNRGRWMARVSRPSALTGPVPVLLRVVARVPTGEDCARVPCGGSDAASILSPARRSPERWPTPVGDAARTLCATGDVHPPVPPPGPGHEHPPRRKRTWRRSATVVGAKGRRLGPR